MLQKPFETPSSVKGRGDLSLEMLLGNTSSSTSPAPRAPLIDVARPQPSLSQESTPQPASNNALSSSFATFEEEQETSPSSQAILSNSHYVEPVAWKPPGSGADHSQSLHSDSRRSESTPRLADHQKSSVDLAAFIGQMSLQFSSINQKLDAMTRSIGQLDSRVSQIGETVDEIRLRQLSDERSTVSTTTTTTPPPPSYVQSSSLPPPPPSFFHAMPPISNSRPISNSISARQAVNSPPRSIPQTNGPSRVPTTINTTVCPHCYLYFTPFDLGSHTTICRVRNQKPSQANPPPPRSSHRGQSNSSNLNSMPAPIASAPPGSIQGEGGRVVQHRGKFYWVPTETE